MLRIIQDKIQDKNANITDSDFYRKIYKRNQRMNEMDDKNIEMEKIKLIFGNSSFIIWRGKTFVGAVQEVAPEFSKEIVLLSKTSYSLSEDVIDTIKSYIKKETLYADDILDLEGRNHFLRKLTNRLTFLTKEQTAYMMLNPPSVNEVNIF